MGKARTTKHSHKRGKQRAGLSKHETDKMAQRALSDGISYDETFGELHDVMSRFHGNIKFYANSIFVFENNYLITMMNIDPKFEKNLLDYVYYPVCVKYIVNRNKHRTNNGDANALLKMYYDRIKNKIDEEFLSQHGLRVFSIDIKSDIGTVRVKTDDWDLISKLRKEFNHKYGMTLEVTDKRKRKIIDKWFKEKYNLRATTTHISRERIMVCIEDADPDYDFSELLKDFTYTFNAYALCRNVNKYPRGDIDASKKTKIKEIEKWFSNQFVLVYVHDIEGSTVTISTVSRIPKDVLVKFEQLFKKTIKFRSDP